MKTAQEKMMDCLFFSAYSSNPNNVVRLYKKFAHCFSDLGCKDTFMVSLNKKGQEILDSFVKPVELPAGEVNDIIKFANEQTRKILQR